MIRISMKEKGSDFLQETSIPKQSEVKNYLGDELAKVVFEFSHGEIKKYLGLLPPLTGPKKELWSSPSDQMLEKNSLKPPIHSNSIKACTHDGILEIGEKALEKYRQDTEERIRAKLNEDLIEEKNLSKAEKRRTFELALQKTRERYRNCVLELKWRFRKKLETELERAMAECKRKMQDAILEERASITRVMMKKMRDEIGFVVTSLYSDFELKIYAEKQNMIAEFNQIMRCDRLKTDAAMREMIRQKEEEFRIKLHELELERIVDLTYVLCSERMRCSSEKHEMHQNFEKQIEALQKMLLEANRVIKLMKKQSPVKENDQPSKIKIMEIVKQFQRFINFAFGAVPGQAEFFLSLESLLTFELEQKISEKVEKDDVEASGVFRVVEIIDKCGRKWRPVQLIPDIQQPCSTEDHEKIEKSDKKCKNSTNRSFRSLDSLNSISFCHFQNTFYERADFQAGDIENERKTMTELAEDARFVMDLKPIKTSISKLERNEEEETVSTEKKSFEITKNQTSKSRLSKESLLENVVAHSQMIKNITEKNEDGEQTFKIVGDDGVEHLQTPEQFKISRMKSLIRIFKLHPSLQRILIPHIGKALY